MQTVIGAFDDRATAQRAVEKLVQSGFDRSDVHVEEGDTSALSQQPSGSSNWEGQEREVAGSRGMFGFFNSLFGDDDRYAQHKSTYSEAVRRGSAVVVVDAQDDTQADRACSLLHDMGAIDVDERAEQWRAGGWTGQPAMQQQGTQQDLRARGTSRDDLPQGKEGVMDVVQEELNVGKRTLDRGGVRVIQRVSQQPVREVVRLREEHATVDRRAVDRPATAEDLSNFREGTMEVRETMEEPVVSKTARVVEEVRVGKDVREREETIEDSVRRKDVDVERLQGGAGSTRTTATERERAVAADPDGAAPLADRESKSGTLTGGRGKGKDKPVL